MSASIWGCTTSQCPSAGAPVPRSWNTCPKCYGPLTEISAPQTRSPYGECSICKKQNYLPHFLPEEAGWYCDECSDWLTLPGLSLRREK